MYIKTHNGDKNITTRNGHSTKENYEAQSSDNSSFTLGTWGIALLILLALIIMFVFYKYFFST